jgi:hypothetical protein
MCAPGADRHSAAMKQNTHIRWETRIAGYVLLGLLSAAILPAWAQTKGRMVMATKVTITSTLTEHSVTLSWQESTPNVTFTLYRGVVSGQEETYQAGITSTSDTDTGVSSGVTYYYTVTAVDSTNQESGYSNEAKAVIPPTTPAITRQPSTP